MELHELSTFLKEEKQRLNTHYKLEGKDATYQHTLKIIEEVGELAEAILHSKGLVRKEKLLQEQNIGEEIVDVILTTLLLGESLGIDLEKAIEKKIEKIRKRTY